jgi:transcriptional regulator with XRE-family HTH domain
MGGSVMQMGKIRDVIASRVREIRKQRGFSLEALAQHAGLSMGMVQAVEYKLRWPSENTLEKIAGALGVTAETLIATHVVRMKPSVSEAFQIIQTAVSPRSPSRPILDLIQGAPPEALDQVQEAVSSILDGYAAGAEINAHVTRPGSKKKKKP